MNKPIELFEYNFDSLLIYDNKEYHQELKKLYTEAVNYIKNKYVDKSKDDKTLALYYVKKLYDNKKLLDVPNSIDFFYIQFDQYYLQFKDKFELIFDETYLKLSFVDYLISNEN